MEFWRRAGSKLEYSIDMATTVATQVNPIMLAWARQEGGYLPEPVAKRINVKLERLLAWERGDSKPTVRQVMSLAKFYHRPFGAFFLSQPPALPSLSADYRRLLGMKPGVEPPEFRLALRVMSMQRDVVLELSEELEASTPEFSISAHLGESPATVGNRLRNALGTTDEIQQSWTSEWKAWGHWRQAVESLGVLVFQFPKVSLEQSRGVSLLKFPLPVIGINSKELSPAARCFTLLHELTHLALALSHEENAALSESRDESSWLEVERFAEEAASEALIPMEMLSTFLVNTAVSVGAWDIKQMRFLAAKFRVTPLAMATRLRAAGILSWDGYNRWKKEWAKYTGSLPKRKGFASPVDKTLGRRGRPLVQLVLEALDRNRITAVQASHYLDLRFDHFDHLRNELQMNRMTSASDFDDAG